MKKVLYFVFGITLIGLASFQFPPMCIMRYNYFPLKVIDNLDLSKYHESQNGWEVENYWFLGLNADMTIMCEFERHDRDTSRHISAFLNKGSCSPKVDRYYKRWFSADKDTLFQLAMNAEDTLYYYNEYETEKTFFQGKHYYLSSNGKLTREEGKYYRQHKDSLDRIRGDTLGVIYEKFPD